VTTTCSDHDPAGAAELRLPMEAQMPDIDDIWDDEEDRQGYVRNEAPRRSTITDKALPTASPCEHCGGTDIYVEREDLSAYQTRCNDCGSRGPIVEEARFYDDERAGQSAAIAAWNRRPHGTGAGEA